LTSKSESIPGRVLVRVAHVEVRFREHLALQDVSLEVKSGEIVTLIGPNGAGKSTLVRVVLGLISPAAGSVTRADYLQVGYMPQRLSVDPTLPLTVKRFLSLSRVKFSLIESTLEEVGASPLLNRPFQHLSGGEMQRVLLARALLRRPDLLVLDEPIQGVDVNGQYELYQLIGQIREQRGCGILMVSHELHLVMAATDHVICLDRRICCSGHPHIVSNHPAYLALFGVNTAQAIAIYQHHHSRKPPLP